MITSSHSAVSPERTSGAASSGNEAYPIQRIEPRTPGSLVPSIEGVRLLPQGIEGSIVNISRRGALILCDRKLGAGMRIRVMFEGTYAPPPIGGRIGRSLVSKIGQAGELWYQVGIAFDAPIDLDSRIAERPTDEGGESAEEVSALPKFVNRW